MLWEQNEALRQRVSVLEAQVEELTRRLRQNSINSSKPPSSDGPELRRGSRPPTGRKRGGQPGHRGTTRALLDEPDAVVDGKPLCCERCGLALRGEEGGRNAIKLPSCPWCGRT